MAKKISKETSKEIADIVCQMEEQLRNDILKEESHKLWENTFIKKQIDRRNADEKFTLQDHIRAMVYSMLSSGTSWDRVARDIDPDTKCIIPVDDIFFGYDTEKLSKCTPEQLRDKVKKIHCATQSTLKQMDALLSDNIPKLLMIEKEYGEIDNYYRKYIETEQTLKSLVTTLSASDSKDKMVQMDIALVCEYLRNVGYDIPKPDRHIRRILGSEYLALSDEPTVPEFEAFDLVVELAEIMDKPVAEVDYILWSYCAKGYGAVCKKTNFPCESEKCVAKSYCKRKNGGNV